MFFFNSLVVTNKKILDLLAKVLGIIVQNEIFTQQLYLLYYYFIKYFHFPILNKLVISQSTLYCN